MAKAKTKDSAEAKESMKPSGPPRMKMMYEDVVRKKLESELGMTNPMEQPRLEKIVLNVNVGRFLESTKLPNNVRETVINTLTTVSGQKPIVIKAKKSVANFKLREGMESAAMVTLRRDRMWHFLDRLINLAAPRMKDFRGLSDTSFDMGGNYSMGVTEQAIFPEIDMSRVNFTHGMHINMVFSNSDPTKSKLVLETLGMPFRKREEKAGK